MASKAYTAFSADVAGGATAAVSIPVTEIDTVLVMWEVTDSGAAGDIGTVKCKPYTPTTDTGAGTLIDNFIPAASVAAARRVAPITTQLDRYDVRGLERINLSMVNGAVGTKNVQIHVYLENTTL